MPARNQQIAEFLECACPLCEKAGIAIEDWHGGSVHRWVAENVKYNHEQEFFIVLILACELADRKARRIGYQGDSDRAARLAFSKCEIVL